MKSTRMTELETAQQKFQITLVVKEEQCQHFRVENKMLTEAVVSTENPLVTKEEECQRLRVKKTKH